MVRHAEDSQAVTTALAKAIIEITGMHRTQTLRESCCGDPITGSCVKQLNHRA